MKQLTNKVSEVFVEISLPPFARQSSELILIFDLNRLPNSPVDHREVHNLIRMSLAGSFSRDTL